MRIFELLNPNAQQQMDALDQGQQQGQPPQDDTQGKFDADSVDADLQNTAQGIDDENAQPEIPQGGETEPPEMDAQNTEPLDNALLSQIKGLPYVQKYSFGKNSKLDPMMIAQMTVADLSSLKNQVMYKIQDNTVEGQIGLDNDKMTEYCDDLLEIINRVMAFKKTSTRDQLAQTNPTPPYQTMNGSK